MLPDILILGGGISGLASALRLHREGLRVTIVERNQAGHESSWAGGGILSPLLPWHYTAPVNRLCDASGKQYAEWLAGLHEDAETDPEFWLCGMRILPAHHQPATLPDQTWCGSTHRIEQQDDTLLMPDVAQARNSRLIRTLREAVLKRGIQLIEGSGDVRLVADQNRITHAESAAGPHQAGEYLITAGAWSNQPAPFAPTTRKIEPVRGQMLLFYRPGLLNEILFSEGTYLIPRRDGHILAGSTLEYAGFDKSTTSSAFNHLLAQASSMLPALTGSPVIQHWSGLRPGSPDNIPTISRHPSIHNLSMNAGHFRYGVTMAPAAAELITDLLLDRPTSLDATPYQWISSPVTDNT